MIDTNFRKIAARWVIRAELTTTSASQIGSADSDFSDETFSLDFYGKPVLRGSTIAGAIRSAIDDVQLGYKKIEKDTKATDLFGRNTDENGFESRLIVFDAYAEEHIGKRIREGVAIENGVAKGGHKYNRLVAEAGLRFPLRIDLIVPDTESEQALLETLVTGLNAIAEGIPFGARKTRGMGCTTASRWQAIRVPLTSLEEWMAYSRMDQETIGLESKEFSNPLDAVTSINPNVKRDQSDARKWIDFTLDLKSKGTLIVRAAGYDADSPDAVMYGEKIGGKFVPVIPGTSIAGVLRHHCDKIARTISTEETADKLINNIFGPSPDEMRRSKKPSTSNVIIQDAMVTSYTRLNQTRIQIDRFTGGTIEGALLEEQPIVNASTTVHIRLKSDKKDEAGLLLLACRDIADSILPLGGESSIGRGFMEGSVCVTPKDGKPMRLNNEADLPILQQYVDALYTSIDEVKS